MKKDETWNEFMDRAKNNGVSPTTQEMIDREDKRKNEPNSDDKMIKFKCINCKKLNVHDINYTAPTGYSIVYASILKGIVVCKFCNHINQLNNEPVIIAIDNKEESKDEPNSDDKDS